MGVAGCTALVTGSNRGIGTAFVTALLERGARKVYAGARDISALAAAQERLGDRLVPVQLDVTSAIDREAVAALGTDIDLVVSNAGVTCLGPVLDVEEADARDAFEVNVFGPLALIRILAPALRANSGGVILVHSLSSLLISRSAPTYSAAKAASLMLGYGMREQLGPDGVVVTNVLPGFVETDMTTRMVSTKASPATVVEESLDGWERGLAIVWPDRYAKTVEDALMTDMSSILEDPVRVASRLISDFASDPLAGT